MGSVCVLENGAWICTGSNDSTICVYSAGDLEPFAVLRGHSATGIWNILYWRNYKKRKINKYFYALLLIL